MGNSRQALGLIETFGLVFMLEAADAMVKAAEVEVVGYENTASGYISILRFNHPIKSDSLVN